MKFNGIIRKARLIKIDLLLIGLILSTSFLTWSHILSLQFTGEGWGFIGTIPPKGNIFEIVSQEFTPLNEYTIDRILSGILLPVFRDQIHLYMWFQLICMLFIDLLMYLLVRILTGSTLAGFITAFLFSISYIGKFETYSSGGYLYFAQRAILLLPELTAIIFLGLYLTKKFKIYYYIISLSLHIFGLTMGFFSSWFLPVFIIYPIIYLLFNLKELKRLFWKVIWVPLPFSIGTMLIIQNNHLIPNESIFDFILNKFTYTLIGIIQQLTVLTFPMGVLLLRFDKLSIEFISILGMTIILYCYAFFTNSKMDKQWKILQATMLLSVIAMFLINIYLQAAEVLNTFGSTRYFYYPYVGIAIFWGISLTGIVNNRSKLSIFLLITFCIAWLAYNNIYIQRRLKSEAWVHNANRQTLEILHSWAPETKKNPSYIYAPANLGGYGGQFVIQFFSHPEGKVDVEGLEPLDLKKLSKLRFSPDNLFVMHFDPKLQQVVDKTEEARNKLR